MFKNKFTFTLCLLFVAFLFSFNTSEAATLLSDDFTGTTIDTDKWSEVDSGGLGGSSGDVQQNGTLTVGNSYVSSTWGAKALVSADIFDSDTLEISATITRNSDALLGYGDINFQSSGTKSYIIDVLSSGSVLALVWNNGSLAGNTACGTATNGAIYKMKILASSFEVYKDGVLQCTQSTSGTSIDDETVYFQSSATASVFDNVLVEGNSSGPTAPGQVTGLNAESGDAEVDLSWTAPISDGGSAITDYLVEYKLTSEPTTWSTFADGTSTSTSTTVTSLTNDSGYDFRVSAINAIGTGTASSTDSATPSAPSAPGQVTGLNPTAGNTQVGLSWSAPSANGSAITDYLVEYKLNSSGSWSIFVDGISTTTSTTVTGLTNDLLYNFRVSAINAIGTGTASSTSNATPVAIGVVLTDTFTGTTIDTNKWIEEDDTGTGGTTGEITQNGTLSITDSFVNGAWGATYLLSQESYDSENLEISVDMTTGSAALFGYGDPVFGEVANKAYLLYIIGAGSGQGVWALSWTGGNYTSTTTCGTSTDGATYTMKTVGDTFEIYKNDVLQCTHDANFTLDDKQVFMQSQNTATIFDNFEVYGIQVADTVPDAPTIGTATAGNEQVSVTFTPPVDNGGDTITNYTVTSSPGSITGTGASSPIIVTGLTNGVSYTFTVTATNGVGTSSASASSNSTTPEAPPAPGQVTGLVATGFNKQVLLGWDAPGDGGTVEDYIIEYKLDADVDWSTFVDGTSTTKKAIVTGLINGSEYNFRVSADNSTGAGTVSAPVDATPDEISNLSFVITGESNSGGIGLNSSATAPEIASRSAVQILELTSGNFLFENLDIGTNNLRDHAGLEGYYATSHGLELGLANSVEAHDFPDNEQIYLIKTGQGGSQVSQWNYAGAYFTKFLQRTTAAKTQIPSDRKWVVWMSIGINDGIAGTNINTFKTNLTTYIDNIKADLPGAIIIMTQFQSMPASSGYPTINTALAEVAALEPNVYVVDTTTATGTDGANHWTYAGLKTVASLMTTTTKNVLGLNYPGLPTSLNATPAGTSVALSWTAPVSNGGSAITDYVVEYKTNAASTWNAFADGTSTTASATVTGLTGSTEYNFRVSAVNANGTGNTASINSTTTDGAEPVISVVTATPANTTSTITWTTDELSSSIVDYGLTNAYGTSTAEADTSPRVTSHSVNLTGLVACTTYHYRVRSKDGASNTATGSDNTFTTTGCVGSADVLDEEISSITTATGGIVELDLGGAGLLLTIPADATDDDAVYQIKQLDSTSVTASIGTPSGVILAGSNTFELKSLADASTAVTSFNEAITLTLTYEDSDVSGIDESTLVIYRWDGATWNALSGCTVDTTANTVTCTTTNFSLFGLFGGASSATGFSSGSRPKYLALNTAPACLSGHLFNSNTGQPCPVSTSNTTSPVLLTKTLKKGMNDVQVKELQKYLNTHGYIVSNTGAGSLGKETTFFGQLTHAAVLKLQIANKLTGDGIVGPMTRAAISGN